MIHVSSTEHILALYRLIIQKEQHVPSGASKAVSAVLELQRDYVSNLEEHQDVSHVSCSCESLLDLIQFYECFQSGLVQTLQLARSK